MLKGTSLLYSGGGEHGLYPEGVIIDRDTSLKEQTSEERLVPLGRKTRSKYILKGTSQTNTDG